MQDSKCFQSIFKINNVPIMPPVIDQKLRDEIKKIRELVRAKELKLQALKEEKDRLNLAKQSEKDEDESDWLRPRRLSYTLTSPIFESDMLPKISADSSESDKDTVVDGPASMQSIQSITSDFDGNLSNKSEKDLRNEIDKRSTTPASSIYEEFIEPQVNTHLRDLIEKQKQEYLVAMETLKNKFTNEQEDLMVALQSNLLITSTPLNSSMAESVRTEDEDFTAFKTALQSQSLSLEEKTIVNDEEAKMRASIIINACARGFLVRRLLKTIYVQEHMRNIRETLQLVLNLDDHDIGSPVQNILLKAKLFRQLQSDLYNFNEIFVSYSLREKLKIISTDRDLRRKKENDENKENLSLSFLNVM